MVVLALWAITLLPGVILGILMSGGRFSFKYQDSGSIMITLIVWFLFFIPTMLWKAGTTKHPL